MTSSLLEIHATYVDLAHEYNDDDIAFYQHLPNATLEILDLQTGQPAIPVPGIGNNVRAIVAAVLSSTVLSTYIETTLKKEPTTIQISVQDGKEKKSISFEGPNIKENRAEIEALLNDLTKENKKSVHLVAKRKKRQHPKPPSHCEDN